MNHIKTVIIMHGITASGKTTLAKELSSFLQEKDISTSSHSTDDFFITKDGHYQFDIEKLAEYHKKNFDNFTNALEKHTNVVICDNTNLVPWQSETYTQKAREFDYNILFLDFKPRDKKEHLKAQIMTDLHPDAHGISEDIIDRMLLDYNNYRDLLYKETIVDPERHTSYIWDNTAKKRVKAPKPSKHYDLDTLIVIEPDILQNHKNTLLNDIWKITQKENI